MKNWISRRSYVQGLLAAIGAGSAFASYARGDQPNMQSALNHLQQAKQSLERADNDKGGHRVKAIKLVDDAIEEVRQGIRYDRRR